MREVRKDVLHPVLCPLLNIRGRLRLELYTITKHLLQWLWHLMLQLTWEMLMLILRRHKLHLLHLLYLLYMLHMLHHLLLHLQLHVGELLHLLLLAP